MFGGTAMTKATHISARGKGRLAREYRHKASDSALVNDYIGGDGDAFAEIVERHQQRMMVIARRYARNEHDAQDILQDALFKASRNMHTFRSEAALTTWLHRLVLNAGFDHAKRADNKRQHVSIDDEEGVSQDASRYLAHDPLANLDRVLALRQILEKLPAAQRRALLLIDVAGLSVDKAARELGVRPGTVKSRRHRAREVLVEMIGDDLRAPH